MKINDVANYTALLFGMVFLVFIFRKLSFGKKAYLYAFLMLPALFFSTFMLSDAVTADEGVYIPVFSDMSGLEPGSVMWVKGSFQYRMTQITIAPLVRMVAFFAGKNSVIPWIVYKDLHWLFYFFIAVCILFVWGIAISDADKNTLKYRISILGMAYVLTGLPVSCLILKVSNYDAGSVYFALLAISLVLAAEKQKKLPLARAGGAVAALGCLEKWVGFIYLMMCLACTGFLAFGYAKERKILNALKEVMTGFGASVAICIANFVVLRAIQGQGLVGMNAGAMMFPVIYMVDLLVNKAPYMASDISYYDCNVFLWLFAGFMLILFTMVLFFLLRLADGKIRFGKQSILTMGISVSLFALVISGIMGCFVLRRKVFPFTEFPRDVYKPASLFNGVSYFYGAKTKAGHMVADICFSNAALMASLPTIACGLLLVSGVALIRGRGHNPGFLMKSYYGISLLLIPFLTVSGQPACARYFAVPILLMCLCSIHFLTNHIDVNVAGIVKHITNAKGKIIIPAACLALYTVEMSVNEPVYNCFSPLWLIRDSEFCDNVRQGEWDAGEAMAWGEELALSGKWLEKYVDASDADVHEIRIVSNYGIKWFSNPGFQIIDFKDFFDQADRSYKNTFFVLAKFRLYRSEIPEYIKETEPIHKIRIKGETTVWIYEGNQLRDYYEGTGEKSEA